MDKIIFGITGLTLGGAERVLVDTANKLADMYDITIFTIYGNGELEKQLDSRICLKTLYNCKYTQISKFKRKFIPLKVFFEKSKIYKKYIDCNSYVAQIAFLEGAITRIFSTKSKNKTKKIAWVHNDISKVFGKGIKSRVKRIIDRNVYEKYDTLVFVSIDNLDKFNKVYDDMDLPHETVIHNYINDQRVLNLSKENISDLEFYKKDMVNIVQVSRLVKQKAIDRLILAHSNLIKQGFKHNMIVIGDGPLKDELEKKIKEEKIENTFHLIGARKNPYPYIKMADYFCLFSEFEGYPMVIEEAKILNKYILCTNTSAREVLVDYSKYCKIEQNSQKGIENAIKYAIKHKNLQQNIKYTYENNKIIEKIVKTINK